MSFGPSDPSHPLGGSRELTDPKAMRALAHPLRLALLEHLSRAGTLTATQAGELVGESPANCSFHLRTLAKYGFVEEAATGHGRERPWRRVPAPLIVREFHDDPETALAAGALNDMLLRRNLDRISDQWALQRSLPRQWQEVSDWTSTIAYVTAEEARRLEEDLIGLLMRFRDRRDDPSLRPPGARPVHLTAFALPLPEEA